TRVLEAAARLLSDGSPASAGALAAALQPRERLASTALRRGVAIPHARSDALHASRRAFPRLGRALDFGARGANPVGLVFAMSATSERPEEHLQHLAEVATRFADPAFRERLRAARGLAGLRRVLLASTPAADAA